MGETGFGVEGTGTREGFLKGRVIVRTTQEGNLLFVFIINEGRVGGRPGEAKVGDVWDTQSPTTHAGPSPKQGARAIPSLLETPLLFVLGGVAVSRQYSCWNFSKDHLEAVAFQVPFPDGQAARLRFGREDPSV